MPELSTDRRFHNLSREQVQTLDQVLTEVIPIHGRGNFPTLEVKPKDIIHVVKDRLVRREVKVRDVRLNGSTASHVLVKENGTSYKDLDIIFGVELPRQEDFQIIKEVVLGCLLDFLPQGVNKDKITALTMKEAYVQKMVKVFNEHDRWSLISLSNNRGKNVELKFVSSLRRQFEFSVDSFQIILDSMLESYLEAEKSDQCQMRGDETPVARGSTEEAKTPEAPFDHPVQLCTTLTEKTQNSLLEKLSPPPSKKTCKKSKMVVLKHSSPKPPRKMSKKACGTQAQAESTCSQSQHQEPEIPLEVGLSQKAEPDCGDIAQESVDQEPGLSALPINSQNEVTPRSQEVDTPVTPRELPAITVVAESMYGDFEQAMDHLRYRLIATRNPEEIRGGGLLKYSNLLVRDFRPASETEIKTLERYMCSRFFIDFPDVNEQQRKIESYLRNHFIGEESSKYDYLMTLRRVINESTVCLMGHERRQTLNMITVLALKVLGEQNAIPNTTNVTCFYQPAPYMADHNFNNYYIAHNQPPLIYHPYPLHIHMQTSLV
ncbi:hypothetical protein AGOR_G00018840 [Albula goreensis]|uniref:polynucleotide adenylyltransferase n=1 Tax=Albula goreensis TaxID=1534307 RepID=A0A8T3E0F5_9TELE|nr:hypothetical protein AGOR_G00018840 [Albula goreensis]